MKVCVLGSNGFIGKNLMKWRWINWVGVTRDKLDLTDQNKVREFFKDNTFDVVIHCAVVGGRRIKEDGGDVMYKNLLMFENVVSSYNGKILYFSSGAALRGNPPTDPYGFSKWLIDKRIETLPNVYCLRIWGCYGQHESSTRFSALCKNIGHIVIEKDRYFDYIDIKDVRKVVNDYIYEMRTTKEIDLVYPEKRLLSEWASIFGATHEIIDNSGLDNPYVSDRSTLMY
jgi:nucleoside-diphosphate-sugar epimerase